MLKRAKKQLFSFLLLFCCFSSFGQSRLNLYINSGLLETVDSLEFPYYAFNKSSVFNQENSRLIYKIGDSLKLNIINTDSIAHGFSIQALSVSIVVNAFDSSSLDIKLEEQGVYIIHDPLESANYAYMGLATALIVNAANSPKTFYWNIKDHQKEYNEKLSAKTTVDWSAYYPDYFTINSRSNPHINQDTNARVYGKLGDTLRIVITNTGRSIHSLHFHGFHCTILSSSKEAAHIGRKKDTFPVYPMEVLVLELVANQKGEYPVHDHNLVAVSAGNIYPNGMFSTILIE